MIKRAFLFFCLCFAPASALEPLHLQENGIRAFSLTPYIQREGNDVLFSIQNNDSAPLKLFLTRHRGLLFPAQDLPRLRMVSSDYEEFAANEAHPYFLSFTIPAKSVQSLLLLNTSASDTLYIWSPLYWVAFNEARTSARVATLGVLGVFLLFVAVYAARKGALKNIALTAFTAISLYGFLLVIWFAPASHALTAVFLVLAGIALVIGHLRARAIYRWIDAALIAAIACAIAAYNDWGDVLSLYEVSSFLLAVAIAFAGLCQLRQTTHLRNSA